MYHVIICSIKFCFYLNIVIVVLFISENYTKTADNVYNLSYLFYAIDLLSYITKQR